MCLLLHELLNILLVLCIVHIARYALRIGKCTCYFTCANLNASCSTQCAWLVFGHFICSTQLKCSICFQCACLCSMCNAFIHALCIKALVNLGKLGAEKLLDQVND